MLSKVTNIIFAVVIALLLIIILSLLAKLNSLDTTNRELIKTNSDNKVLIAEQTVKLNQKLVEVVHVPSVEYEEKIIQAKPIIEYVTKETVKILDNPILLNTCISPHGLQLVEILRTNSLDAELVEPASEPSGTM